MSSAARRPVTLALLGLVVAVLAVYANSFSGVFVFDDEPGILRNPSIRQLWPPWGVLCPPTDATVGGRPVANLTFAVNYAFSGVQVWSYHAVNLLIHLLAGLTLFGVVRRTLGGHRRAERDLLSAAAKAAPQRSESKRIRADETPVANLQPVATTWFAFAVASLWALHPLQTEAVTYVVQRVESLMALFFLLTFYCFLRSLESPQPRRWRVLAVVACLLGMGTKEVMAVAPLLLLLYDRTFVAGTFRRAWTVRRTFYLALAATWVLLAALVASTGWNRGGTVGFDVGLSPWAYWLTQFEAVVHYLRLAVWPHPLVFDYATPRLSHPVAVVPYAVAVLALVGATIWALRRRPVAGFLGAWFFLILAPTSVVPSSVQAVVEHRMYLPLAAVAVAAGWSAHRWFGRRGLVLLLAVALGLGGLTVQRNKVYRSERAVWADTVARCPDNDRARNNLGNVLAKAGETAAAIGQYQEALRLCPESSDTHFNLGNALQRLGRTSEAIAHYERALQVTPGMPDAQTALGVVLEAAGREAEAVAHYEVALRLAPGYAEAHHHLGILCARAEQLPAAITHFEQALRSDPAMADAHSNLGNALAAMGRLPEAIAQYEWALRLDPDFVSAHNNLGRALAAAERLPEAIVQFQQVLRLTPDESTVHNDLGMIMVMAGRAPEAVAHFEAALRLDPDRPELHLNLATALERLGRADEAAVHYEAARRLGLDVSRLRE